ncbi:MAG TPA: cyclic nucleotide-binding domain-containing protein [Mycobacteriales bacterium]|jgi:CRP-like cAMP-binding protein|nr:cyclic nucleotide-binding domain-containing protein [Mycobacteriales bacterium]
MKQHSRLDDLRQLPVFATLPRRSLRLASRMLTPVSFAEGDVLCVEGHIGREAFIIVEGEVEVSAGADHIATVGAGSIVGEMALLGDGRRTASVTASAPVRALVMSPQEFAGIMALPGVATTIQQLASERGSELVATAA